MSYIIGTRSHGGDGGNAQYHGGDGGNAQYHGGADGTKSDGGVAYKLLITILG